MKNFNNSYIQDPVIENVSNGETSGRMFKFSSGYAVYVGAYTTQKGTFTKQGNISISDREDISLRDLGFTTILGGSVAKDGFEVNNAIFGTFFGQNAISMSLFRGDNAMYSNVKVSIVIFGFWK